MSRIARCFARLKELERKALIPYITAGDPNLQISVPLMHALVEAGADIIELGVPFSDPMADGPVIQAACERALKHQVSLRNVLGLVRSFREKDQHTPIVLMGYLNPIEVMGYKKFTQAAIESGVDGVLTVDLPPEESHELVAELRQAEIDPIFLIAPTSSELRIKLICEVASGFVYYVSLKGVTGASSLDVASVQQKLFEIRKHTTLPIGVGFGIKDAASAEAVAQIADAVVVGSALVRRIAANAESEARIVKEVTALLGVMREAMDNRILSEKASV